MLLQQLSLSQHYQYCTKLEPFFKPNGWHNCQEILNIKLFNWPMRCAAMWLVGGSVWQDSFRMTKISHYHCAPCPLIDTLIGSWLIVYGWVFEVSKCTVKMYENANWDAIAENIDLMLSLHSDALWWESMWSNHFCIINGTCKLYL